VYVCTAFVTWLAVDRHVASSAQNQAFSAVLFLYRHVLHQNVGPIEHVPHAKVAVHIRVLSTDEVRRVLKELSGVSWLVASLFYRAGLRLQECLELRVKAVRSQGWPRYAGRPAISSAVRAPPHAEVPWRHPPVGGCCHG
jgi:site-specific recombinase XerD